MHLVGFIIRNCTPLSIIRSYSLYIQQWYMSYRFVESFRAGSGWNAVPSRFCSKAVNKPVWHIPLLRVQWITPDDGQRNCPKHVEFHFQNKIWEISASSWFYYKESNLYVVSPEHAHEDAEFVRERSRFSQYRVNLKCKKCKLNQFK